MLHHWLAHPLTRGLDADSPQTTALRKRIIKEKNFLYALYTEWYQRILTILPAPAKVPGAVVELGSGGGFFKELLPECVSTEVFLAPDIDMVLDGCALPFAADSLRGLVLVDVFHHIPDVAAFLCEAERTLACGGVLVMLEPWNTTWSRFVYQTLHSEAFVPDVPPVKGWAFPSTGPLSGANGALPWLVFDRDKAHLAQLCPALHVENIALDYPFSYLASGGVSMRALSPAWSFTTWRWLERSLRPFMSRIAMFACITLRKQ